MVNRSPSHFGSLLKRHRMAALLTQQQLADRAHLSLDAIRALERGKRRTPRPDSARLLADALTLTGVERAELLAAATPQKDGESANQGSPSPQAARLMIAQPTTLLGRERELETIRRRLLHEGDASGDLSGGVSQGRERTRLLTLTGPAGVGKTRLALAAASQLAAHFPDGIVLVDLAPIRDPLLVLPTVARAFGFVGFGARPLLDRLLDHLRERSMLVLLDNFEQALPAASVLSTLLGACPGLSLLVTSRAPLQLRWEWTLRVSPLPTPDLSAPLPPLNELMDIPSVALFVQRARQSDFTFTPEQAELVARVTSELDGLPLALELAASRLGALSLPTLARQLGDRLSLLHWETPDLPERQQSLEAAIGWSYDLLTLPEQRAFRSMGVFVGRVTLNAITAVASEMAGGDVRDSDRYLDMLTSLAEKSLALPAMNAVGGEAQTITLDEDSESAFTMLETVRKFAWEQLERQGELEVARQAHADYYSALAEQADPQLRGPHQLEWYRRLEHEQGNLRAALRWLMDQEGPEAGSRRETALRMASDLAWFWWTRGYLVEGWRWLEEAMRRAPEADPALRIRALLGTGTLLAYQGKFDHAKILLKSALSMARHRDEPAEIARVYTYLGVLMLYSGDVARSIPTFHEALGRGRSLNDSHVTGLTLMFLGAATLAQGQVEQAATYLQESLLHFESAGEELFAGNLHINLGWFAMRRGDLVEAVDHIRIGLERSAAFVDRRLLGVAAQMAIILPSISSQPAHLAQQARLLGAIDTLSQATGVTAMQMVLDSDLAELRQRVAHAGLAAQYREGQSLAFQAIVRLVVTFLESVPGSPHHRRRSPSKAREIAPGMDTIPSARQRDVIGREPRKNARADSPPDATSGR